jgi:hypothetical protein
MRIVRTFATSSLDRWSFRKPAAAAGAVAALSAASGIKLPEEYLALLRLSNGGDGPLSVEPGWFQLWPVDEVLALNRSYRVHEYLPGLFGFGSNGGGELLALDTRRGPPWPVVMVPFIGMEEDTVVEIAEDFAEFLRTTGGDAEA